MAPRTAVVLSVTLLFSSILSADRSPTTTEQASPLLNAQRAVAGSTTVTALALEGQELNRMAFVFAENGQPSIANARTAEWLFMLPDRYRRTSIGTSDASYRGFSGERPLIGAKSLSPGVKVGVGAPGPTFVPSQRIAAARLLLGILGTLDGPLRLVARADATGAIHVTGPNGFECFVDLDPATNTPLRVRYIDMAGFMSSGTSGQTGSGSSASGGGGGIQGAGRAGGGSGAGRSVSSGPPERAELTIAFADRRPVGGVMIPLQITTTARSLATGVQETLEEFRFEQVTVNPPLTAEDIERDF